MGSADHFLLLRSFLILASRALDFVGKVSRYPVTEHTFVYRLIRQQIHNQLFANLPKLKKINSNNNKKTKPTNIIIA